MRDKDIIYPWGGVGLPILILSFFTGIFYIIFQWAYSANVEDPFFVGILIANTYALYRFAIFLERHLIKSSIEYEKALAGTSLNFDKNTFIRQVFSKQSSLLSGTLFGFIFFLATISIRPWGPGNPLNSSLGAFLFFVNTLTGMALYSLYTYFKYSINIGASIRVELWDRSSPAIGALVDTNRYVVLSTAFVACAGIISVMFSKFTLNYSIALFSLFSIAIILLAYTVPLIPITAQIREKKKQELGELSQLIQNEYARIIKNARTETSPLETTNFDSLLSVRKTVKRVKAFPPVGEQSINTAMSVAFLTMLPSIIDFVLNLTGLRADESLGENGVREKIALILGNNVL